MISFLRLVCDIHLRVKCYGSGDYFFFFESVYFINCLGATFSPELLCAGHSVARLRAHILCGLPVKTD